MQRPNLRSTLTTLGRGLRKRCARCGQGRIFQRWHEVRPTCEHCGLNLQDREGDCWAFMYVTTAFITGLFFLVILLYRPPDLLYGRVLLFAFGLALLALSLPYRKSIALAIEYLLNPEEDVKS